MRPPALSNFQRGAAGDPRPSLQSVAAAGSGTEAVHLATPQPHPAPAGAATLPAAWYRDPSVYERERREVFAREWVVVARAAPVERPGSYVAGEIAGYPVVVVRGEDGVLRAFHNVCRHRAGPLVPDGAGTCRGPLVCRYHGWSYRHDGALARARDFGTDVDPASSSLWSVQVAEWANLVWVNLDLAAPGFGEDLATFVATVGGFPFERYSLRAERHEDLACNWKTYVDNYLEGYHIPFVHPTLVREVDVTRYRVDARDRWCEHRAPARDGAANLGRWLWRWPNLALNLYPDGMNVERILPLGPDRTRVTYSYFFAAVDEEAVEHAMAVSNRTLAEDREICEAVQRNLDAGVYDSGVLSPKHEAGVAHFHDLVRRAAAR
jgi:choline monooxygenase